LLPSAKDEMQRCKDSKMHVTLYYKHYLCSISRLVYYDL